MSWIDAPRRPTRRPRRRRALSAWGLTTLTALTTLGGGTGCTVWSAGPLPSGSPTAAVTYEHPIRLQLANQSTVVLTHARVVGDSLVGLVGDAGDPPPRYAVALGDVRGLEEQRVSTGRTVALVAISLAAFAIALAVAASQFNHSGAVNIPGPIDLVRSATHLRGPGRTGAVGAP